MKIRCSLKCGCGGWVRVGRSRGSTLCHLVFVKSLLERVLWSGEEEEISKLVGVFGIERRGKY
jgi:hypothetical protein